MMEKLTYNRLIEFFDNNIIFYLHTVISHWIAWQMLLAGKHDIMFSR